MNIDAPVGPQPASAVFEGEDLVGAALIWPMPSGFSSLSFRLFHCAMAVGLRARGIEPAETAGFCGADFIVWTMATQDRNPALRAVEQVIKEMELWGLCEVAFFDKAERYWRTIHPYGAAPFNRLLSQSNIDTATQQLAAEEEMIRSVQSAVKSLVQAKQGETQ